MEACELILWLLSDMSRERGNGLCAASLELSKRIQVALVSGITILLSTKGLEDTERLRSLPQDQVADWLSAEPFHLICESCAGTDAESPSSLLAASSCAATLMVSP